MIIKSAKEPIIFLYVYQTIRIVVVPPWSLLILAAFYCDTFFTIFTNVKCLRLNDITKMVMFAYFCVNNPTFYKTILFESKFSWREKKEYIYK